MTSKERVLTAIDLQKPDQVPINFSANPDTLKRLMKNLNASSHSQLLEKLHVDIVDLRGVVDPECVGPVPKERILAGEIKEYLWGIRTKAMMTATGIEECYIDFILAKCQTKAALERHCWPSVDWFDFSDFSKRLDPWQNYAVMASGASVWQHPSFLRGMEMLMVDLLAHQEMAVLFWRLVMFCKQMYRTKT